jgi:hypothetical protein
MGEAIRIDRARELGSDALRGGFRAAMAMIEGTFEEREARALGVANDLVRRWIGEELQAMADELGDEVEVAGHTYRRQAAGTVRYHTLCGAVAVRRSSYRQVGVHNGPTVVPLELRAGIWENATPALAFSVTQGFASRPLREYELEMTAAHREVPSRSTLERIGKRIGNAIDESIAEAEPWLRAAEPRVDGVHSISVGLDRTTVPMAEPIPDAPVPEPRVRRRPRPVEVAYRMAYVGTVSLHDDDGNVLVTKRFGATPQEGPHELVERIVGELIHQRARHGAPISAIQDGAPELWNLVAGMRERGALSVAHEVIDRFHVDERLAQVCEAVLRHPRAARELYEAWRYQLDHSDTAIDRIIGHLDALVWHSQLGAIEGDPPPRFWRARKVFALGGDALTSVGAHREYLRRNRRRIRYASRRRAGLPIGSGPTEGACKSLVTVRFKRGGQRWFESGLAPCLSLRALHLSERLRPAFARSASRRMGVLAAA